MPHQKQELELYKDNVEKAVGQDPNIFSSKMAWLKNKWSNIKEDSEETRLMHPIILHETTPINLSIIADNVDYFQNHYKETPYKNDLEKALARACLCGSQKIADFLLQELNSSYRAKKHARLLGYISASMNTAWMKEVALTMAQAKRDMPKSVFGLADNDEIIDMILEIFKKKIDSNI